MTLTKEYKLTADEGFQAIMLELVGKDTISRGDFEYLIKGLLLAAHESEADQILFYKSVPYIQTKAFK